MLELKVAPFYCIVINLPHWNVALTWVFWQLLQDNNRNENIKIYIIYSVVYSWKREMATDEASVCRFCFLSSNPLINIFDGSETNILEIVTEHIGEVTFIHFQTIHVIL